MIEYIFHRPEGFYFVEYKNDSDAIEGALFNEGTVKVQRAKTPTTTVWEKGSSI